MNWILTNLRTSGFPHAAATQLGAMTVPELGSFLERGERAVASKPATAAEAALARGDRLLATKHHAQAVDAYSEALRLGGRNWADRDRAAAALTAALMSTRRWQPCAETAADEAPRLKRREMFGRIVYTGLSCANQGESAPWAAARKILEPLAADAIALPATVRDHRFQLYQQLMYAASIRADKAAVQRWGGRWLAELDAARPASDDERSALDIGRVDAASILDDPSRVLPQLIASERAMPNDYNASLRLAQMQSAAKQYDAPIAACDRGLLHVTGPLGRTWLLQVKAEALIAKGASEEGRRTLQKALGAARQIGMTSARDRNVARISEELKKIAGA